MWQKTVGSALLEALLSRIAMVGSVRLVVPVKELFTIRLAKLLIALESCSWCVAGVGLDSNGVAIIAAFKQVKK